MPVINLNNILFTGKVSLVPTVVGAQFSLSQTQKESFGAAGDFFGTSLAVSGSEVAVGDWNAAPSGTSTKFGLVKLYTDNGSWQDSGVTFALSSAEQASSGTTPRFGYTVSMSNEWLVVGAPNHTGNGRVFVYRKVNGIWNTNTFAILTPTAAAAMFGYSVAVSGNTIVVGHINANSNNGQVDVFAFDGAAWNKQASLTTPNVRTGSNGQRIGWSVAINGNTLAAGGIGNNTGFGPGQVIVSTRTGSTWSAPVVVAPSGADATSGDGFGYSVRLRANKLIVGSPGNIGTEAGRVFIFGGSSWTQEARMSVTVGSNSTGTIADSSTTSSTIRPGISVECNDDATVIFAGANAYATNIGAAYVFEKVVGNWQGSAISNNGVSRLDPADKLANTIFGGSMQYSNGQLLVGASGALGTQGSTTNPPRPGAFYVFK